MKKVLTMTLNPCIDRTVYMESFQVGKTNVVNRVIEEVAGKGINVAVGLRHLNIPVKAMGFAYKEDLHKLYGKLDAEQIPYSFVEVEGRLRVNQKLFDESKSEMTECNEKGMPVSEESVQRLLTQLKNELQDTAILVLSGSVPPSVAKDIYAIMATMANEAGVKVILDANGDLLREGVKAKPYLIKPNREEFVKTFMNKVVEEEDIECENTGGGRIEERLTRRAREVLAEGVSYICLSLGEDGAILLFEEMTGDNSVGQVKVDRRPAIAVPVRSLQGAGDAMVAGLCKAIYEGNEDKMLDYALNMAASTIMLEGTRMGNGCIE